MMIGHVFHSNHRATVLPWIPQSVVVAVTCYFLKKNLNATTAEQSKKFFSCLKKIKLDASRPSGHPPVKEENVKTFRWDHNRLQRQNR